MLQPDAPPLRLLANSAAKPPEESALLDETPALYLQHGAFVWRVLNRLGVPEADREDLLQEVFLVVHRMRDQYQGRGQVTTWLYGIALRVASRHQRRRKTRREVSSEAAPQSIEHETPEGAADARRKALLLERVLVQLPEKKRVVFVMFELEGLGCGEIAAELGVPIGTVYSRLHEARETFARAWHELNSVPAEVQKGTDRG